MKPWLECVEEAATVKRNDKFIKLLCFAQQPVWDLFVFLNSLSLTEHFRAWTRPTPSFLCRKITAAQNTRTFFYYDSYTGECLEMFKCGRQGGAGAPTNLGVFRAELWQTPALRLLVLDYYSVTWSFKNCILCLILPASGLNCLVAE